ncbi:MAG: hypothetical protein WAW36_06755 [Methylovulum miyakonense]|uniref:hypothetical protein n=1 Tax=Methylovulum miyakonense TaxID=645578 RepID=UPI003BB6D69D
MKPNWQIINEQLLTGGEISHNPAYATRLPMFKAAFFLNSSLDSLAELDLDVPDIENAFGSIKDAVDTAVEALFYFFTNQYGKISEKHLEAPAILFGLAQEHGLNLLNKAHNVHVSALPTVLGPDISGDLQLLVSECKNKDCAINLVENALSGLLSLSSPFSENRAYCRESYEVPPDLNCLRFTDGGHTFFLIQLLSSADALYFPANNLLLNFSHINESHTQRLQEKLLKNFAQAVIYATSVNTFSGVIASHNRPSHYYYDVWPALYELASKPSLLDKLPAIIMRSNHDFNDVRLLFGYGKGKVLDSEAIDKLAVNENKWFIHVGRQQHLSGSFAYEVADNYLVGKALQSPTPTALAKAAQIADCYPVVWIGVEGQKRCWLEQTEGYAYILNGLVRHYPKLGVIFDGWTMPYTPSAASLKEAERDDQVARNILDLLDAPINHVSVIGETSNTKLVVGNLADFFISNFSTGSQHISRFLRKPGFCHLSQLFSNVALRHGMHRHPNPHVYLFPKEHINDQQDQDTIRHDYLSYSIDKTLFYQFIKRRLTSVLGSTAHPSIRLFIEPSYSVTYDLRIYIKMAAHGNILHAGPGEDKIVALKAYPESYLKRQLIYGTFPFGSDKKAGMQADYLIWLRHPIPRVCFHASELRLAAAHKGQSLTIRDVFKAGHRVLDNYFTRMLSGSFTTPFGKCTEQMLLTAISNLKSRFIFIGINEQPAESYDFLCAALDWDRALFTGTEPLRYEFDESKFSDAELLLAKERNSLDLRLYEVALEIFNSKRLTLR